MQVRGIKKRPSTGSYVQDKDPQKTQEETIFSSSSKIESTEEENEDRPKKLIKEFDIPGSDMETIVDSLYEGRLAVARKINANGAMELFFNQFETFYWIREILISKRVQYSLSYVKFKLQKAMTRKQEKGLIDSIEEYKRIKLNEQEIRNVLKVKKEEMNILWQKANRELENIFDEISRDQKEDTKKIQDDNLAAITESEWRKYKFIWQQSQGMFDIVASNDKDIIWQIINAIDNIPNIPLLISMEIQTSYPSDWNKIIKPAIKETLEKIWDNKMPKL
jgi:hypothetical protein